MQLADILVIFLFGLAILNGAGLLSSLERCGVGLKWWERLSFGTVLGLALLALSGLLVMIGAGAGEAQLGTWLGAQMHNWVGAWLPQIILAILLARSGWLPRTSGWRSLKLKRPGAGVIWYGFWFLLCGRLAGRVIDFDAAGVTTAPASNYGDLAFHLSVISSFAFGGNMPPENPIFAGVTFTYPFLIDLLTALPVRMGAGWEVALLITTLPLLLALVGIVESLGERLTGRRWIGRLALLLLFFNGGLGFLSLARELREVLAAGSAETKWPGIVGLLVHPPAASTINNSVLLGGAEIPVRYGNLVTTLLIPQRSLMFGLPLVGMIIILWQWALTREMAERERRRVMVIAGILTGLLPLLHAHGFLAALLVAMPLALIYRGGHWLGYFGMVGLVGGIPAWWLSQTGVRRTLFAWHPGWEGRGDIVSFWIINNGPFLAVLLVVLGVLWWRGAALGRFMAPFWVWFIVPNLVLLAPWAWDNMKIFVYWALISSVVVGWGLHWLLRHRLSVLRVCGVALLGILLLSGMLDVWRGLSPVEKVRLLTTNDLLVAAQIREMTPPRALILHTPIHNSPLILTGRRSFMGYAGHLWSHGIDYEEREAALQEMMRGGPRAAELLRAHGIDYVLVDADDEIFRDRYPLVFAAGGHRLYRTRGE